MMVYGVDMVNFVAQLPRGWQGLMGSLTSVECMVSASSWLIENIKYGELDWTKLICSLNAQEPYRVNEQGSLLFGPRVMLLPVVHCQRLLSFIYLHRHKISQDDMKELTTRLLEFNHPDSWIKILVEMLSESCNTNCECVGFSNETNSGKASTLLEKLKQSRTESVPCPVLQKLRKTDNKLPITTENVVSEIKEITEIMDTNEQSDVTRTKDDMDTDDVKIREETVTTEIDKEIIARLIECFQESRESELEDWKKLFAGSNVIKQTAVAEIMQLSNLPENTLVSVSKVITGLSESVTSDCMETLINNLFYTKVCALEQNPSRVLLSAVAEVVQAYPTEVLDAVLLPISLDAHIGTAQADTVLKVLRDYYKTNYHINFIKKIVDRVENLSQGIVPVLQTLLDQKLEINEELMSRLLASMERSAAFHGKNPKFGKLILTITNKYPHIIIKDHLSALQSCVDIHETFLAKTAASAIKRLLNME